MISPFIGLQTVKTALCYAGKKYKKPFKAPKLNAIASRLHETRLRRSENNPPSAFCL
jgi:hypothetical protein